VSARSEERAERTFTQAEVSAIVQKRLRESKAAALNADVCIEMMRNVMERLDALEARLSVRDGSST
jgi:hypothetical protein